MKSNWSLKDVFFTLTDSLTNTNEHRPSPLYNDVVEEKWTTGVSGWYRWQLSEALLQPTSILI